MGVESGGGWRGMPQVALDDAQVDSGFQEMGRPRMAQGVNRRRFGHATLQEGGVEGPLHTAHIHRGLPARLSLMRAGKEPDRMAMRAPITAEHLQNVGWERDIAVLVPFPVSNMDELALSINVTDLQVHPFLQAQPARINGAQTDSIAR